MNSIQIVAPKQCTVAQCAHLEPRSRAHCARSAHVVGAAARTTSLTRACRVRSQRRSRACWACTYRDTPRQPAPRSRPHFDVATSRKPESCRDIKSMSRHHSKHSRSRPQNGVATPNLLSPIHVGRDVHFLSRPHADQTRSQPQVMSRPQIVFPKSQHEFHVAT